MESDTFKYFRTQFSTVANNRISVEVRDIEGKLRLRRVRLRAVSFFSGIVEWENTRASANNHLSRGDATRSEKK